MNDLNGSLLKKKIKGLKFKKNYKLYGGPLLILIHLRHLKLKR